MSKDTKDYVLRITKTRSEPPEYTVLEMIRNQFPTRTYVVSSELISGHYVLYFRYGYGVNETLIFDVKEQDQKGLVDKLVHDKAVELAEEMLSRSQRTTKGIEDLTISLNK